MGRPIDADALRGWLLKAGWVLKGQDDGRIGSHIVGKIIEHLDAMPTVEATAARLIRPDEYATWESDAWAEDLETGVIVALDRSAVQAYVRYIEFDVDSPKRLWTARPGDEARRATRWQSGKDVGEDV